MRGLNPVEVVYRYDGTLEGLFSAVLTAYERHEMPVALQVTAGAQGNLLATPLEVSTDEQRASRVRDGICRRLGVDEYERIRMASLSDRPDKATLIFRYIVVAMRRGPGVWNDLADHDIQGFEALWRDVYNERHRILQFARFSCMEGGVYYARVNPKANVVPVVMDHFAQRFNIQPFIVHDEMHGLAGVWNRASWGLVSTDTFTPPPATREDSEYQHMWRVFYDSICNQRRYNPRLRMQFMPQRLWRNMTEMQPEFETVGTDKVGSGKTRSGTGGPEALDRHPDRALPPKPR